MDCSDENNDLDDTVVMESDNEADENVEHSNIVDIIRSSSSAGRGAEVATSVAKRRRGSRGKVFRQRDEAAPLTHSDGPVIACTQGRERQLLLQAIQQYEALRSPRKVTRGPLEVDTVVIMEKTTTRAPDSCPAASVTV
ncbi:hypothetical protein FOZ63_004823 [Perkinsus olseni]|uniref:Uncharacterized protein n=1 Tax=Perkinsus olseni TaxID=32597 RepID=A0A7J6T5B0_PEROL|nr:hypothetical protein FOZ62_004352 [Perkinsus olseni]KAF4740429.1 hypothetical protein FOZ63_004823 [Perkinsus olseni]